MPEKVRDTVTLHPETVQKGEKLAKEARARKRKPKESEPQIEKRYKKRPPNVYPGVWAVARTLAGADPKRMIVESDGSVLVVNPKP